MTSSPEDAAARLLLGPRGYVQVVQSYERNSWADPNEVCPLESLLRSRIWTFDEAVMRRHPLVRSYLAGVAGGSLPALAMDAVGPDCGPDELMLAYTEGDWFASRRTFDLIRQDVYRLRLQPSLSREMYLQHSWRRLLRRVALGGLQAITDETRAQVIHRVVEAYVDLHGEAWLGPRDIGSPLWFHALGDTIRPNSCQFVVPCYDERLCGLLQRQREAATDLAVVLQTMERVSALDGTYMVWTTP